MGEAFEIVNFIAQRGQQPRRVADKAVGIEPLRDRIFVLVGFCLTGAEPHALRMNRKCGEYRSLQALRQVGALLFQPVHNDKSPARGLLEELWVHGNLRDRTDTKSSAEITGITDSGTDIESLLYVLIMWKPDKGVNV